MGNMYSDSVFQWNVLKGCTYSCIYCLTSFQRQAKRQKPKYKTCSNCSGFGNINHKLDKFMVTSQIYLCDKCNGTGEIKTRGCQDCYDYKPHIHEERLDINFNLKKYETKGDKFIWACSSGDISCMEWIWMSKVLQVISKFPNRTFFMQTKDPNCFWDIDDIIGLPDNLIIGITLETNRDKGYNKISQAPSPSSRQGRFAEFYYEKKIVTIEPILDFDLDEFVEMIREIQPIRVYIGYNSKKTPIFPEPSLAKTLQLIKALEEFTVVKEKLIRERKKPKQVGLEVFQ